MTWHVASGEELQGIFSTNYFITAKTKRKRKKLLNVSFVISDPGRYAQKLGFYRPSKRFLSFQKLEGIFLTIYIFFFLNK